MEPGGQRQRRMYRLVVPLAGGAALMLALFLPALAGGAAATPTPVAAPFTVTVVATPSSGAIPLTVSFAATVSAGVAGPVTWTFGDGSGWTASGPAGLSVTHRYVAVGSFVATAQVTESTGTATGATTVQVQSGPIVAAISASPSSGASPLGVTFRAVVSGGTGTYPEFDWSFGDGGSAAGAVVSHTFRSVGDFVVTLSVTDSANATSEATFTLSVTAPSAGGSSPWTTVGPTTLATAGIVGAGLTWGVYYAGRRRRQHRIADDEGGIEALPPGVFGPRVEPIPSPLGAQATSEAAGAAGSVAESSSSSSAATEVGVAPRPARPMMAAGVSLPVTPSTGVKPEGPSGEPRRWSRDLVAYLGQLPTLGPDDIATLAWTQKGMSDRLGTGQNQISNVLRRLVASGLVVEELQHVQGQPRRLKVYRLSMRGEALARELRRRRTGDPRDYLKREW